MLGFGLLSPVPIALHLPLVSTQPFFFLWSPFCSANPFHPQLFPSLLFSHSFLFLYFPTATFLLCCPCTSHALHCLSSSFPASTTFHSQTAPNSVEWDGALCQPGEKQVCSFQLHCDSDPRAQVETPEDWALADMRRADMHMKETSSHEKMWTGIFFGTFSRGWQIHILPCSVQPAGISSSLISWLNHWNKCFSACFRQMSQVLFFFNANLTAWEAANCQTRLTEVFRRPYESQCHHLQLMAGQTEGKWFVQGISKEQ